ncbi:MAG: type II toxin-antitoxin system PemK/MazF family toxin [Roseburia sp.]|nr:type II toxin-antitoxin system PemK/MazF family toxin [Roseburia sp.]
MNPEAQEYYNIAAWVKDKINYHRISQFSSSKRKSVLYGEIWYCDMGYNIGTEKNKIRPVLVISNNKINRSEKVVVVAITDAKGKVNARNLPIQDSWLLLYSSTSDDSKMFSAGRVVPPSMHTYDFLDKDSMLQCEEIRAVSKSRLDSTRGCIGTLEPADFALFQSKFKRCYNL